MKKPDEKIGCAFASNEYRQNMVPSMEKMPPPFARGPLSIQPLTNPPLELKANASSYVWLAPVIQISVRVGGPMTTLGQPAFFAHGISTRRIWKGEDKACSQGQNLTILIAFRFCA